MAKFSLEISGERQAEDVVYLLGASVEGLDGL